MKTGVWKIMLEVVKKPLDARKYGVSALLRYAMRGASSRLHSKAERVLRLLMSDSVLGLDDKLNQGKRILSLLNCHPFNRNPEFAFHSVSNGKNVQVIASIFSLPHIRY